MTQSRARAGWLSSVARNVGKSSLLNKLAGHERALVDGDVASATTQETRSTS